MGGEVPAKLFAFMRETSRRMGADINAAQAGLALPAIDTEAPAGRVDWNDVACFLERAHAHQTVEEIERLGELYAQMQLWQLLIARVIGTPRLMYEICLGPLTRASFPHLDVSIDSHADGVRFEMVLPARFEPSPVFFRGTVGEVRQMTTLIGRPPARVDADVGPRHGVYDIALDEPPMRLDRAVRAAGRSYDLVVSEAVQLVRRAISGDRTPDEPTSVLGLQRRLGLTHMEARVSARLADGMGIKDIARALGVRVSTVRTHLKSAYAKTGCHGQTDLVRLVLVGESRPRAQSIR